ncbi:MAG: VanW family protein [Thermomicrobiales bacterium]
MANGFRPVLTGRGGSLHLPASILSWSRALLLSVAGFLGLAALMLAAALMIVRGAHAEKIFPAVSVADVPIGGLTYQEATAALAQRADQIEVSPITFTLAGKTWSTTYRDIGVSIDAEDAVSHAAAVGREPSPLRRLQSFAGIVGDGERVSLPVALDFKQLDAWFDTIDSDLGTPARNASVTIDGSNVAIVPEVDGKVVDRERARAAISAGVEQLQPVSAELPVVAKIATVRAVDLEPARNLLVQALSHPIQVTNGAGVWTLPATDLGQFLRQEVKPAAGGAPTMQLSLDHEKLTSWLEDRLGQEIETEPQNAEVGWDGSQVVSVVPSVDGAQLDADKLAYLVENRFFDNGGTIKVPVVAVKPEIDSANLDKLGITTLLGSGSSNYAGSSDGRAHNVAVGAQLLNGTLVPPYGEFSFNGAIGLIDEDKGFVQAQVIAGEKIGKDIGGGICQVSTTVFRAAYLAGLPITEWWPHRFRIGFYEYDGWKPGLDASILQPTDDPSTWADFKFENPSGSWMLLESWTDGERVTVNIYGADLGYQVESTGPTWGEKTQMLPPQEVVDPDLAPGTVTEAQTGGIGEELSHYRVVRDRDGNLLWERSFYTKYFPRGEIWTVSEDMKGQAPIDPDFKFPPLAPAGVDSKTWEPPADAIWTAPSDSWSPSSEETAPAADGGWTPEDAQPDGSGDSSGGNDTWAPAADDGSGTSEEWVPPAEDASAG